MGVGEGGGGQFLLPGCAFLKSSSCLSLKRNPNHNIRLKNGEILKGGGCAPLGLIYLITCKLRFVCIQLYIHVECLQGVDEHELDKNIKACNSYSVKAFGPEFVVIHGDIWGSIRNFPFFERGHTFISESKMVQKCSGRVKKIQKRPLD